MPVSDEAGGGAGAVPTRADDAMARGGAAAVLMTVSHHHVNVDGLGLPGAPRVAQPWRLDHGHENQGSRHGRSVPEARRPGRERMSLRAPFSHQGRSGRNPAKRPRGQWPEGSRA